MGAYDAFFARNTVDLTGGCPVFLSADRTCRRGADAYFSAYTRKASTGVPALFFRRIRLADANRALLSPRGAVVCVGGCSGVWSLVPQTRTSQRHSVA